MLAKITANIKSDVPPQPPPQSPPSSPPLPPPPPLRPPSLASTALLVKPSWVLSSGKLVEVLLLYVYRNRRFIRYWSPGRPPQ